MEKKLLEELKQKLEKERITIEEELKKFAKKDEGLKDDWDTRFPKFNGGETGGAALEKAADELEEYSTRLPLEYNLELQLKDINLALEKMVKGTYGKCENCKGNIDEERLKAYPAARLCLNCEKKQE